MSQIVIHQSNEIKFPYGGSEIQIPKLEEELLGQQVLILVNQNFRSFFTLLKKKKAGNYAPKAYLPRYLDKEGYHLLTFISRLFRVVNGQT